MYQFRRTPLSTEPFSETECDDDYDFTDGSANNVDDFDGAQAHPRFSQSPLYARESNTDDERVSQTDPGSSPLEEHRGEGRGFGEFEGDVRPQRSYYAVDSARYAKWARHQFQLQAVEEFAKLRQCNPNVISQTQPTAMPLPSSSSSASSTGRVAKGGARRPGGRVAPIAVRRLLSVLLETKLPLQLPLSCVVEIQHFRYPAVLWWMDKGYSIPTRKRRRQAGQTNALSTRTGARSEGCVLQLLQTMTAVLEPFDVKRPRKGPKRRQSEMSPDVGGVIGESPDHVLLELQRFPDMIFTSVESAVTFLRGDGQGRDTVGIGSARTGAWNAVKIDIGRPEEEAEWVELGLLCAPRGPGFINPSYIDDVQRDLLFAIADDDGPSRLHNPVQLCSLLQLNDCELNDCEPRSASPIVHTAPHATNGGSKTWTNFGMLIPPAPLLPQPPVSLTVAAIPRRSPVTKPIAPRATPAPYLEERVRERLWFLYAQKTRDHLTGVDSSAGTTSMHAILLTGEEASVLSREFQPGGDCVHEDGFATMDPWPTTGSEQEKDHPPVPIVHKVCWRIRPELLVKRAVIRSYRHPTSHVVVDKPLFALLPHVVACFYFPDLAVVKSAV